MTESVKKPKPIAEAIKRVATVALAIGALLVGAEVVGDIL